jgi:hypothetical protein
MPEENAEILRQDLIWVNALDRRCKCEKGSSPDPLPVSLPDVQTALKAA